MTILNVLVVLLSLFNDDIRVDNDLVWVRVLKRLLDPNCWFPMLPSLLLLMFVMDDAFSSLDFSRLDCHWLLFLFTNLQFTAELTLSDDSEGTFPTLTSS
jgi:hypothetical protein